MLKREWFVLHVKSRCEKKVFTYLKNYGYYRYLPVYVKVTKVQRRKVRTEMPLFPGYVFTKLNRDERIQMLQTNLIVNTIPVPRPREMVHQLRQISRASRNAPELRPATAFKTGDLVRVKYGPFRGVEGYIKREGAASKIVVNLDILGQAVEMLISPNDCEACEKNSD